MLLLTLLSCRPEGTVTPTQEAPVEGTLHSRERRRMNIDQLRASMEQVSGGISWTETIDGETVVLLEKLSVTLGRPDYLASTEEMLAPDLLFQKFLDDAAKATCTQLLEEDPWRASSERALLVHADLFDEPGSEAVAENMSAALLRFHGRSVPVGDPQLDPWLALFSDAHDLTASGALSWQVVCVTLFTHPDFYSF